MSVLKNVIIYCDVWSGWAVKLNVGYTPTTGLAARLASPTLIQNLRSSTTNNKAAYSIAGWNILYIRIPGYRYERCFVCRTLSLCYFHSKSSPQRQSAVNTLHGFIHDYPKNGWCVICCANIEPWYLQPSSTSCLRGNELQSTLMCVCVCVCYIYPRTI